MISGSKNDFKGLPSIYDHTVVSGDRFPIDISELDHIVRIIASKTVLTREQAEQVVRMFFQEIRGIMLRGDRVVLRDLGRFYISSPATTGNKGRVILRFKASTGLKRRLRRDS